MTVIGRLDEQVDAVLIEPLKRRRHAAADDAADVPAQAADELGAVSDTTPAPAQHDQRGTPRAAKTDLPVWLL